MRDFSLTALLTQCLTAIGASACVVNQRRQRLLQRHIAVQACCNTSGTGAMPLLAAANGAGKNGQMSPASQVFT